MFFLQAERSPDICTARWQFLYSVVDSHICAPHFFIKSQTGGRRILIRHRPFGLYDLLNGFSFSLFVPEDDYARCRDDEQEPPEPEL